MGSKTPGSGVAVTNATLRGVESFGMLCSAFDLGWLDEPDGVLVELPDSMQPGEEIPSSPVEVGRLSSPKTFGSVPRITPQSNHAAHQLQRLPDLLEKIQDLTWISRIHSAALRFVQVLMQCTE